MAEDGESRLSRWSRLKQRRTAALSADSPRRGGAKPVALDDPRAAPPPVPGEAHAENAESLQEVASLPAGGGAEQAPPPSDSPPVDLPPVESLNKESDFKAFLADGVPEELKRAALRKLWLSDPAFAFRDGLDDYDENFRIVDKMLATADELRKGWAGTEEQAEPTESAESAEPGEEEDEDDAGDAEVAATEGDEEIAATEGDEEIAAAEGDEEASDGTPEPGRPEKERE